MHSRAGKWVELGNPHKMYGCSSRFLFDTWETPASICLKKNFAAENVFEDDCLPSADIGVLDSTREG